MEELPVPVFACGPAAGGGAPCPEQPLHLFTVLARAFEGRQAPE